MRILICGSRTWSDPEPIVRLVGTLPEGSIVIHGGAPGADEMAGVAAITRRLDVLIYPADWTQHGRAAGPIRNRRMLVEGQPDLVVAFFVDRARSKGTANMVAQADQKGVEVWEFVQGVGWTRGGMPPTSTPVTPI